MRRWARTVAAMMIAGSALSLSCCGESARLPLSASFGPHPQLPPPNVTFLPTIQLAPAIGWRVGEQPRPAAGLAVTRFAIGLDHPRNIYVLPNGDVLVAETSAPSRPDDNRGLR